MSSFAPVTPYGLLLTTIITVGQHETSTENVTLLSSCNATPHETPRDQNQWRSLGQDYNTESCGINTNHNQRYLYHFPAAGHEGLLPSRAGVLTSPTGDGSLVTRTQYCTDDAMHHREIKMGFRKATRIVGVSIYSRQNGDEYSRFKVKSYCREQVLEVVCSKFETKAQCRMAGNENEYSNLSKNFI